MVYNSISDYVIALSEWLCVPAKITSEGLFINGRLTSVKEHIATKPEYQRAEKENPDTTFIACGVVPNKGR